MKDIANELGVSVTTISKTINNHPDISSSRRKQIMALLEERNYVPNYMAKNLRSAKTKFISLIVSDNANPFYARIIKGVESVLSKYGYYTIIFNNNEDPDIEHALVKDLLSINVAGVIITPALGNNKSTKLLNANGVPYVLVSRYIKRNKDNYVVADDVNAAYLATRHLIQNHGERVGFLNASPKISAARDRLTGYKKALKEANIPFIKEYVINNVITAEEGNIAASAMIECMRGEKFSLLNISDYVAVGAMQKIYSCNLRIPEDVAIMGIDGIKQFSYIYPGLSSVYLPKYEMGVKSAELLLSIIERKLDESSEDDTLQEETHIVLEPKLIINGTA